MSTTKLDHGDDHDETTGADPVAVRRGYEEDVSNVSSIWAIPAAVVLFLLLGISVAAATFYYFNTLTPNPMANANAVKENEAPLNKRMGRIGRAGQGSTLTEQPRLEGLRVREGDGQTTSRPVLRSGNSPQFHPEDVRASAQKALQTSGWVEKGKVARISIDEAMKLSLTGHLFPVRKDPVKLTESYQNAAAANAGRGALPASGKPPAPAHDGHDHK